MPAIFHSDRPACYPHPVDEECRLDTCGHRGRRYRYTFPDTHSSLGRRRTGKRRPPSSALTAEHLGCGAVRLDSTFQPFVIPVFALDSIRPPFPPSSLLFSLSSLNTLSSCTAKSPTTPSR